MRLHTVLYVQSHREKKRPLDAVARSSPLEDVHQLCHTQQALEIARTEPMLLTSSAYTRSS
jgi:hypothetical protein